MNPRRVVKLAEEWIRAEYMFRLGPGAYEDKATDRYVLAEQRLRRAVTGTKDLHRAFLFVMNRGKDDAE